MEDSKFPTPRMPLFHWESGRRAGVFEIPETWDDVISWGFGGNFRGHMGGSKFPTHGIQLSLGICMGNRCFHNSQKWEFSNSMGILVGMGGLSIPQGMQLFRKDLVATLEDSKFLMPRILLFHGKLGGELEYSTFAVPGLQQFPGHLEGRMGGSQIPHVQNDIILGELGRAYG